MSCAAFSATPITPREPIALFNGKDLSNFTTWETVHRREDPDRVFSVVDQIDGAPAIRMSGQHHGGILTKERYTNYRLILEFRWGSVTWGSRKDAARDSGVLLHCQGEEGNMNATFTSPWMRSIEAQIIEGGTGTFWCSGDLSAARWSTRPSLKATVKGKSWSPDGELKEYSRGASTGSTAIRNGRTCYFRGARDVENRSARESFRSHAEGGNQSTR